MLKKIGFIWLLLWSVFGHGQSFIVKTYFDDDSSKLKEIVNVRTVDSTLNGRYQSFFQNGRIQAEGYYQRDIPDSLWSYYYETGGKKAEGYFDRGKQIGTWTYFYENNSKKAEGYIENGIRNGFWTNYFENGIPKSEGSFWNGKKSGIWNYNYEDGTLKAQAYYENGVGVYKEFYPSGSVKVEGKNRDEESFGIWKYYWETGELQATGEYKNGLRHGLWEFYHKNQQLSAIGAYQNGLRTGLWKYYHPNGNLSSEGILKEEKKDGEWTLYYNSGEILGVGNYQKDDGNFKEYYPSGTLKAEGKIKNGVKDGQWIYYDDNGVKEGEAFFENGIGEYTGFYLDGSAKMKGKLKDDKRIGTWKLFDKAGKVVGTYRPIYEEDQPFFKMSENTSIEKNRRSSDIPEYKFKNKSSRFFDERINEYKGIILSTNPLWVFVNRIPVSLEYYMQERLGYELEYKLYRDPFFTNTDNMEANRRFNRGHGLAFKQKFYSKENRLGLFYFGHEIRLNLIDHIVKVPNGAGPFTTDNITMLETSAGYGVLAGWRWLKSAGDAGFISDVFIGADIGYRSIDKNYENNEFDNLFEEVNQSTFYVPINIGINIGWMGPKQKNKNE